MAEDSKIEWTDATFNPWRGCTKVSAGCQHCYADTLSKRNPLTLGVWGPNGTRVVAAEKGDSGWAGPVKWNRLAAEGKLPDGSPNPDGHRPRVFCASLADVFEDWSNWMRAADGEPLYRYHSVPYAEGVNDKIAGIVFRPDGWTRNCTHGGRPNDGLSMDDVRRRLFALIDATPNLDWLLVTKRPENVRRMTYDAWCPPVPGHVSQNAGDGHHWKWPANVWLGTSVENQAAADARIPHLLRTPAAVRFLSCEPLLEAVELNRDETVQYCCACGAITPTSELPGGTDFECGACGDLRTRERGFLDTREIHWVIVGGESGPGARPFDLAWARSLRDQCRAAGVPFFFKQMGENVAAFDGLSRVRFRDKGGNLTDIPADLRVREFPTPPEGR